MVFELLFFLHELRIINRMSFVERKDEFFMKKILITYLVVFFSVMTIGNVYSNDEKCIGPYDYKTVYKDYKKIINELV